MTLRRLQTAWVRSEPESVVSEESNHASPERDAAIDEEVGGAGGSDMGVGRGAHKSARRLEWFLNRKMHTLYTWYVTTWCVLAKGNRGRQ